MINKDTIIRTILLFLALVNQILSSMGKSIIPIDDELITNLITLVFTVSASIWAWWKNNSFTAEAVEADKFMKELKNGGN
ncbi:MAG: phage holin [Clostridia bacterium]|nr:phage holin [Clostridia bacterium]